MTGEKLKAILISTGLPMAEIARRVEMSPQNLNAVFVVGDVKSGLLERLSIALDRPMSWFYGEASTVGDMSQNTNSKVTNLPDGIITLFQKKDEQIDRLLTIIEKMK